MRLRNLALTLFCILSLVSLGYIVFLLTKIDNKLETFNRYNFIPLTFPMTRVEESVCYQGTEDISVLEHFTYFRSGKYVNLPLLGHRVDNTCWEITDQVKSDFPDWESNSQWAVDVMWPKDWPVPSNVTVGTTSK